MSVYLENLISIMFHGKWGLKNSRPSKKSNLAMLLLIPLFSIAPSVNGADAPLLPPNNTGDLYVIERDCDCILSINPGGNVSILVSNEALYDLFFENEVEEVYLDDSGMVSTVDGALYFLARGSQPHLPPPDTMPRNQRVIKRTSDGTLSFVNTIQQILVATGEDDLSLESLVMGDDEQLYIMEGRSDSLLKMNPGTGVTTKLVSEVDFEALVTGADFDAEVGMAADENYIYVASDGIPNTLYRVSYDGVPEVFASGPGVDPTVLIQQEFNLAIKDSVTGGTFNLVYEYQGFHNIPYNITTADLQTLMADFAATITGEGSESTPWQFTLLAGREYDSINDNNLVYAGVDDAYEIEFIQEPGMANVVDHVEAVAVEGASGSDLVSVDIEFNYIDALENINIVEWLWNATAAEVKTTIENNPDFADGGSVDVTGTGTKAAPWLMTWSGGPYAKQQPNYDEGGLTGDGTLYVGTMVNAIAFDDPDGYMARREDGSLIVEDDSRAHFLYEVTEAGETSIFVNEWELVLANDGDVDMEGGMAFDSNGVLHVATDNEGDDFNEDRDLPAVIFRIQPNKTISRWVEASDVTAVTLGDPLDVEFDGMAFQQMSVQKVSVCHKPGKKAEHTLTISSEAVAAHLNHGDYVGSCED